MADWDREYIDELMAPLRRTPSSRLAWNRPRFPGTLPPPIGAEEKPGLLRRGYEAVTTALGAAKGVVDVASNYYSGGQLRNRVLSGEAPIPSEVLLKEGLIGAPEAHMSKTEQYARSIGRGITEAGGRILTDPVAMTLMGGAMRATPGWVQKPMHYGFMGMMAHGMYEGGKAAYEKFRDEGFSPAVSEELAKVGVDAGLLASPYLIRRGSARPEPGAAEPPPGAGALAPRPPGGMRPVAVTGEVIPPPRAPIGRQVGPGEGPIIEGEVIRRPLGPGPEGPAPLALPPGPRIPVAGEGLPQLDAPRVANQSTALARISRNTQGAVIRELDARLNTAMVEGDTHQALSLMKAKLAATEAAWQSQPGAAARLREPYAKPGVVIDVVQQPENRPRMLAVREELQRGLQEARTPAERAKIKATLNSLEAQLQLKPEPVPPPPPPVRPAPPGEGAAPAPGLPPGPPPGPPPTGPLPPAAPPPGAPPALPPPGPAPGMTTAPSGPTMAGATMEPAARAAAGEAALRPEVAAMTAAAQQRAVGEPGAVAPPPPPALPGPQTVEGPVRGVGRRAGPRPPAPPPPVAPQAPPPVAAPLPEAAAAPPLPAAAPPPPSPARSAASAIETLVRSTLEAEGRVRPADIAEGMGISPREASAMLQGLQRAGFVRWSKADHGFIAGEKLLKQAVAEEAAAPPAPEPPPAPPEVAPALAPVEGPARRTTTGEAYTFEHPGRRGPATEAALSSGAARATEAVRGAGYNKDAYFTLDQLRDRLVPELGEGQANAAIREALDRGTIAQDSTTGQFYDPRPVLPIEGHTPAPRTDRVDSTWTQEARSGSLAEGEIQRIPVLPDGVGSDRANYSLTPEQARLQHEINSRVEADPEWFIQEYIKRNSKNGTIELNADEARELFPEYAKTLDSRSANAPTVHEAASWIVKQVMKRTLGAIERGEVPPDKTRGVLFMAGMPGSGKTTASRSMPALSNKAFAIFDGTMGGQPEKVIGAVGSVIKSGGRAEILYVYGGDPVAAFPRTLNRALGKGRTVQAGYYAEVAGQIPQGNLALRQWYAEKLAAGEVPEGTLKIQVVDNSGKVPKLIGGMEPTDTAGITFLRGLEYSPKEVSDGIRGAAAEWARAHVERDPAGVARVLRGSALGELVPEAAAERAGAAPGGRELPGAGRRSGDRAPPSEGAQPERLTPEPAAAPAVLDLALRVARENGGRVTGDLLQQAGLDAPTARKTIRAMEIDGLVRFRRNAADYALTDQGKAAAKPTPPPKKPPRGRAPRKAAEKPAPEPEPPPKAAAVEEPPTPPPVEPVPEGKKAVDAAPLVTMEPKSLTPKAMASRTGQLYVARGYHGNGAFMIRGETPKISKGQIETGEKLDAGVDKMLAAAKGAEPVEVYGWTKPDGSRYGAASDGILWLRKPNGDVVALDGRYGSHVLAKAGMGKRQAPTVEWAIDDQGIAYAFVGGRKTAPFAIVAPLATEAHPVLRTENIVPAKAAPGIPRAAKGLTAPTLRPPLNKEQAAAVTKQLRQKYDPDKPENQITIEIPGGGTMKLTQRGAQALHMSLNKGETIQRKEIRGTEFLEGVQEGIIRAKEVKPLRPAGVTIGPSPGSSVPTSGPRSPVEQALEVYGGDPLRAWVAVNRSITVAERTAKAHGEVAETTAGYQALQGLERAAAEKLGLEKIPADDTPEFKQFLADAEKAIAKARADVEAGKQAPIDVDAAVKGKAFSGKVPPLSGRFILVNEKGKAVDPIAGKPLNSRGDAERAAEAYTGIRGEQVRVVDRRASEAGAVSVELLAAPILLPAKLIGKVVTLGADLIGRGFNRFGPWASEMASRLGGLIEGGPRSLRHIWDWARGIFRPGRTPEPEPGGPGAPPPPLGPTPAAAGGPTPPPFGGRRPPIVEPTRAEARRAVEEATTRQGPLRPETPRTTGFPVNTERLGGPSELREAGQRLAEGFRKTLDKNREYRSWAEARENFLKAGLTEKDWKRLVQERGVVDDAMIEAGRSMMDDAAARFNDARARNEAAKKAGDQDAIAETETEMLRHALSWGSITAHRVGASAEVARALNIHKHMSARLTPEERMFQQIVKEAMKKQIDQRLLDELAKAALAKDHARMQQLGRQILKPTFIDKVNEWFINNILSAPPTWGANVAGNWGHEVLLRTPERGLAGLIESALAGAKGRVPERLPGEAFEALKGQWKHGFGGKHFTQILRDVLIEDAFDPTLMGVKGEFRPPALPGTFGKVWRSPSRMLRALDKAARSAAYEGQVYAEVYREGFNSGRAKGFTGTTLRNHIDTTGKALSARMQEWRRIDLKRQFGGDASLTPAERVTHADAQLSRIGKNAEGAARESTFQDQVGSFTSAALHLRATHPWLTLFVPFISTPSRILSQAVARTPVGLARAVKRAATGETKGGQAADELARGLWGSMIGATLYGFANAGFITGSGPTDPDEQRAWQKTGKQPYAVKLGDKWVSMARLEPMATILGLSADLAEAKDAKKAGDVADKLMATLTNNVMSKTYLDGVASLIEAVQDPERYGSTYAKKMIGAMAVPNLLATAARAIDPTVRDTSQMELPGGLGYVVPPILSRIPFASERLPARLTGTGEPLQREEGAVSRFISPFRYTTERGAEANLERTFLRTGYIPSEPPKDITIPGTWGRKALLTRAERELYSTYNERATAQARQISQRPEFDNLPPEYQEYVLKSIYRLAHDAARKQVLRSVAARRAS